MTPGRVFPVFSPMAEHGLLVEFGDTILAEVHAQVLALDASLRRAPFDGYLEAVPAYASLLIRFDPLRCDHRQAQAAVQAQIGQGVAAVPGAHHVVEVCYEPDLAPDLPAVAKASGLTPEAVIAAHLAGAYQVYLYGFAPGYAYLAGVPEPIRLPRKPAAVRSIPAGSVLIAGPQCIVSTLTMPTGWWVIGRSPTRILTQDAGRPFLFDVGDHVRFRRIDRAAFDAATGPSPSARDDGRAPR